MPPLANSSRTDSNARTPDYQAARCFARKAIAFGDISGVHGGLCQEIDRGADSRSPTERPSRGGVCILTGTFPPFNDHTRKQGHDYLDKRAAEWAEPKANADHPDTGGKSNL